MDFHKKNWPVVVSMIFIMIGGILIIIGGNPIYLEYSIGPRTRFEFYIFIIALYGELIGFIFIAIAFFLLFPKMKSFLVPRISSDLSISKSDRYIREIQEAIDRIQDEPDKAKPAWDLARVRLEMYFDRNLSQINYIFWLSVVVLVAGFGFILYGISQSFIAASIDLNLVAQMIEKAEDPDAILTLVAQASNKSGLVATLAGVITEFVGATFLFIYRSTINQAALYTETLERINSVGMAMQILYTISSESKELQDKTKSEIVISLLNNPKDKGTTSPTNK